jgi:hypothetical protein
MFPFLITDSAASAKLIDRIIHHLFALGARSYQLFSRLSIEYNILHNIVYSNSDGILSRKIVDWFCLVQHVY